MLKIMKSVGEKAKNAIKRATVCVGNGAMNLIQKKNGDFFTKDVMTVLLVIIVFGLIVLVLNLAIPDLWDKLFKAASDQLTNSL